MGKRITSNVKPDINENTIKMIFELECKHKKDRNNIDFKWQDCIECICAVIPFKVPHSDSYILRDICFAMWHEGYIKNKQTVHKLNVYQKRPVNVEAVQWFPDKPVDGVMFPAFHVTGELPDDAYSMNHCGLLSTPDGDRVWKGRSHEPNIQDIRYERYYVVEPSDWIVTDHKGHIRIYKPDIFNQTFETLVNEK